MQSVTRCEWAGDDPLMQQIPRRGLGRPPSRRPRPIRAADPRRRTGRPLLAHHPPPPRWLPRRVRRLRHRNRRRIHRRRPRATAQRCPHHPQPSQDRFRHKKRPSHAKGPSRPRLARHLPMELRRRPHPASTPFATLADIPAQTDESNAMSKALRANGFNFVGPTICYAFMQSAGMVNDHVVGCFRYPTSEG